MAGKITLIQCKKCGEILGVKSSSEKYIGRECKNKKCRKG